MEKQTPRWAGHPMRGSIQVPGIMTSAEGTHSADWATQAPLKSCFLFWGFLPFLSENILYFTFILKDTITLCIILSVSAYSLIWLSMLKNISLEFLVGVYFSLHILKMSFHFVGFHFFEKSAVSFGIAFLKVMCPPARFWPLIRKLRECVWE